MLSEQQPRRAERTAAGARSPAAHAAKPRDIPPASQGDGGGLLLDSGGPEERDQGRYQGSVPQAGSPGERLSSPA